MKRLGQTLRMHACSRCGGAAYLENLDEDEWRCLQCGRSVAPPQAQLDKIGPARKETVRAA